jgi:hypothetical protein
LSVRQRVSSLKICKADPIRVANRKRPAIGGPFFYGWQISVLANQQASSLISTLAADHLGCLAALGIAAKSPDWAFRF